MSAPLLVHESEWLLRFGGALKGVRKEGLVLGGGKNAFSSGILFSLVAEESGLMPLISGLRFSISKKSGILGQY